MKRIADCGLRNADSEIQADAPVQATANEFSPSIHPAASRNPKSEIRNPQSVELHIEELVLHGFAPGDRYAIGDAVQHEIARLLAEPGGAQLLGHSEELSHVDAGSFDVRPNAKPGTIGTQIAAAVHGRIMR